MSCFLFAFNRSSLICLSLSSSRVSSPLQVLYFHSLFSVSLYPKYYFSSHSLLTPSSSLPVANLIKPLQSSITSLEFWLENCLECDSRLVIYDRKGFIRLVCPFLKLAFSFSLSLFPSIISNQIFYFYFRHFLVSVSFLLSQILFCLSHANQCDQMLK